MSKKNKKSFVSPKYMELKLFTAEGNHFVFITEQQHDAFNAIHEDIATAAHFFRESAGEFWPMPIWIRKMVGGKPRWDLSFCVDVKVHKDLWRREVGQFLCAAYDVFTK